jgi:TolB-like protein/class 3 adenylate cyclase/Tfp pilus assembly protein PilF
VERKLTAILAADVVGYSRLMGEDEAGTLAALKAHREELIAPKVAEHHGRIVKLIGDGILIEFPSVVEAVQCAVEVQEAIALRNAKIPEPRQIVFRMGVNLGDVMVEGDDIYGDGVNVAARLEELAASGGVTVSGTVHEHVVSKLNFRFEDLGVKTFKNIREPVHVYHLAGASRAGPDKGGRPEDGNPAIVVLPFNNLSDDPGHEYFCDGLTQDITTELSKFPNFFVIAAKSAFSYKNLSKHAEEIGRELQVRYILEGSIQRTGNDIRVNAQLIDAETGHHLWARRFDKKLTGIFEIQEEVIELIVGALVPKMSAVERARAAGRPTENINAYDAFLRGAHHFSSHLDVIAESENALLESRRWFEKAIELDPGYARAWGWLAYSHVTSWTEGWAEPNVLDLAKDHAEKAVTLEPEDYDTHWALAYVYHARGELDLALGAYMTALELNRNDPDMLVEMAETMCCVGQHEDAVRRIERAMIINPRFPEWYRWMLGWSLYHQHNYKRSNEQLQMIIRPNNEVRLIMAANHAQLGESKSAAAALSKFLRKRPDWTVNKERQTLSYRHSEDEEHWLAGVRLAGLPEH